MGNKRLFNHCLTFGFDEILNKEILTIYLSNVSLVKHTLIDLIAH